MPGAGKSYYGSKAAIKLKYKFIDLDEAISANQNLSIPEIFKIYGEDAFRKMESETLRKVVSTEDVNCIIACGGGTPCFNENMQWMNTQGITVWLDCPLPEIEQNLKNEIKLRPLIKVDNEKTLEAVLNDIFDARRNFYAKSHVKLNVYRGLSPYLFTKQLHLSTFAKNN